MPNFRPLAPMDSWACMIRDFPTPDFGPNIGPFPIKNEQKLPNIIPNFLVLHFGENFMKIRTKMAKLQMHKKFHKNVNENSLKMRMKPVFIHIFMRIFMSI